MNAFGETPFSCRELIVASNLNEQSEPVHAGRGNNQRGDVSMAMAITHRTLSESDHSAQLRKAVIASTIGTAIEWYDFFLYGTAAGLIFGKLYFPNEDALTATL